MLSILLTTLIATLRFELQHLNSERYTPSMQFLRATELAELLASIGDFPTGRDDECAFVIHLESQGSRMDAWIGLNGALAAYFERKFGRSFQFRVPLHIKILSALTLEWQPKTFIPESGDQVPLLRVHSVNQDTLDATNAPCPNTATFTRRMIRNRHGIALHAAIDSTGRLRSSLVRPTFAAQPRSTCQAHSSVLKGAGGSVRSAAQTSWSSIVVPSPYVVDGEPGSLLWRQSGAHAFEVSVSLNVLLNLIDPSLPNQACAVCT